MIASLVEAGSVCQGAYKRLTLYVYVWITQPGQIDDKLCINNKLEHRSALPLHEFHQVLEDLMVCDNEMRVRNIR
jgi:hypothetical protein